LQQFDSGRRHRQAVINDGELGDTVKQKRNDCNLHGWRRRHFTAVVASLLFCTALQGAPAVATDEAVARYALEVTKSRNELVIKEGDAIIKRYYAAFGRGGKGAKRRRGDDMTPVGAYRIMEFKADSPFYFFMLLDYPNLVDGWHGYRDRTIDASQFKAIATAYRAGSAPPQNTALGGYIGIHGIGESSPKKLDIHRSQNWTRGCIALRNEEVNELRAYVTRGTRVIIRE
jgi:murein L,D-transpeptidase YafK